MRIRHPDRIPSLVFVNGKGEILDCPDLQMAGSGGGRLAVPDPADLIELPRGSELFVLPGRLPVGIDPATREFVPMDRSPYDHQPVQAVAAFMAPAHTAVLTAAYRTADQAPVLPLFAYTAVGWHRGKFWAAAFRSDSDCRQDPGNFDQRLIDRKTKKRLAHHQDNRLIQHLGKCCLTYACPAARNYFLDRWEAPLPTSPICNANCAGCISLQPSACCTATQDRIQFVPTPAEIAAIAVPHLHCAPRPVVSFGQGCEGEPLLQAETLEKAIRLIRSQTTRGTINLNTNGSRPEAVRQLAEAGLDSIRISLNSARAEFHDRYYRPGGFSFQDVRDSITVMKERRRHVSLNYFILPGFTDDPDEFAGLCKLVEAHGPDLIQLRNLNMDPEAYLRTVEHQPDRPPLGIRAWLEQLKKRFPALKFGYFNPSLS